MPEMRNVLAFEGSANSNGSCPRYALMVTKTGAFEIHRWVNTKKLPNGGKWRFYKAMVNARHAVERMFTLTNGDILAEEMKTLEATWDTTMERLGVAFEREQRVICCWKCGQKEAVWGESVKEEAVLEQA